MTDGETAADGSPAGPSAAPAAARVVAARARSGRRTRWRARDLVRACHPEPTAAVTTVAAALAVTAGRGAAGTVAVASAVLAGQLCVGWQNDYLDRHRDARTRRADKPLAGGALPGRTVAAAAAAAGVAAVPLSLLSGTVPGLLHVAAVASALSYNLRLKATAFSVLPYAVSFGLLPAFVVAGGRGHPVPPPWLVLAGALLGSGAHFANVLPDLDDDARTGIRGLPHRLGPRASRVLAYALMVSASLVLAAGPPGAAGAAGVAATVASVTVAGAGLWWGRREGSRAAFVAVLVLAVVDVGLLLAAGPALR